MFSTRQLNALTLAGLAMLSALAFSYVLAETHAPIALLTIVFITFASSAVCVVGIVTLALARRHGSGDVWD